MHFFKDMNKMSHVPGAVE